MILTCPSCTTRFLVNSALIPQEGRQVKCAQCAHSWFVTPDANTETGGTVDALPNMPEAAQPAGDFSSVLADEVSSDHDDVAIPSFDYAVPAVSSAPFKPWPWIAATVLSIAIISIALLYMGRDGGLRSGMLRPVYSWFGMYPTDGVVLADLKLQQRQDDDKTRFFVEGYIVNQSIEDRRLPTLRVALANASGKWLLSREYAMPKILAPKEAYAFKASKLETSFGDEVDHVVVELGDSTQLMQRR